MQTVEITKDLSGAIDYLEDLLNGYDSDKVIEIVKNYKKYKDIDEEALINLINQNHK